MVPPQGSPDLSARIVHQPDDCGVGTLGTGEHGRQRIEPRAVRVVEAGGRLADRVDQRRQLVGAVRRHGRAAGRASRATRPRAARRPGGTGRRWRPSGTRRDRRARAAASRGPECHAGSRRDGRRRRRRARRRDPAAAAPVADSCWLGCRRSPRPPDAGSPAAGGCRGCDPAARCRRAQAGSRAAPSRAQRTRR